MSTRVATGSSVLSQTEAATKGALRAGMASLQGEPSVGILFGSSKHDLGRALAVAAETMPGTSFVGASTAGELTERGFTHGAMSAILVSSDDLAFSVKTATGISRDPGKAAQVLCSDLDSATRGAVARGLANSTTVLLADTLTSPAEWLVSSMRKLSKPHHRIVGGAPADDGALKATYTGASGKANVDAATALHMFTRQPWGIGVEHGLRPVTEKKTVTKAKGSVIEMIDGKPAFQMFEDYIRAQGLHVPADKMIEFVDPQRARRSSSTTSARCARSTRSAPTARSFRPERSPRAPRSASSLASPKRSSRRRTVPPKRLATASRARGRPGSSCSAVSAAL